LAFELSMLGLDEDSGSNVNAISDADAEILRKNNANGANMTECVPVPSSEHVAEIVGRQGKISSFILLGYICTLEPLSSSNPSIESSKAKCSAR
jgi:hypothetical protein